MGKGMNMTPLQKLRKSKKFSNIRNSIVKFPAIILDKYSVDFFFEYDKLFSNYPGNDVLTNDFIYLILCNFREA